MDAVQQNVRYHNTATLANVGTVQGQDEGKNRPAHPDKLPLSLRRRVMINQPEKNDRKLHLINQRRTPINRLASKKRRPKLLIFIWTPRAFNQENTVIKKRKINI